MRKRLIVSQIQAHDLEYFAIQQQSNLGRGSHKAKPQDSPLTRSTCLGQLVLDRLEGVERLTNWFIAYEPAEALAAIDQALDPQLLECLADRDPTDIVLG